MPIISRTILGIDPGSRRTGYGIICSDGQHHQYITSGTIITVKAKTLAERLLLIFSTITDIIQRYAPQEAAIEAVFVAKNPSAALKLGQARGAAITAICTCRLPVSEYSARAIKKCVTGYGASDKLQVSYMIGLLLNVLGTPSLDAADALATAICHAQTHLSGLLYNSLSKG